MNQVKAGSILTYAQMALSTIISLVYTPVMLRLLGQSEYGLYSTISSVISMLSVLNLGFSSSYMRFYMRYKVEADYQGIAKLNGLFMTIFSIIGMIALALGLFLSFNLEYVFDKGLTTDEYEKARILMLMFSVSLGLSFPMSVFSSIITAHEQFVFQKVLNMGKTVLSPLLTIPMLLLGYGSIGMVAVTVGVTFLVDLGNMAFCFGKLKTHFSFGRWQKGLFRQIAVFSSFIAINMIVDQINTNVDKVIIGRFRGTGEVSVYNIGATLGGYVQLFALAVSSVFTPRIHTIVASGKDEKEINDNVSALFTKVGRIQFLILGLVVSGVVFFGKPFIGYWAGEGYEDSYYIMLLLTLPSVIPWIQSLGIEIQRAKNKHQYRSFIYGAMAIINLVISIFLCKAYGAVGSAWGTAIAVLVSNVLIMNIVYKKVLGINVGDFFKNILRQFLGMIIPFAIGALIMIFVPITSVWILLVLIIAYTAVYCLFVWFLSMNRYEKDLVFGGVKKLLGKIKNKKGKEVQNGKE